MSLNITGQYGGDPFAPKEIQRMNRPAQNWGVEPRRPGAAAGDPTKFLPRFKILLRQSQLYTRELCFSFLEQFKGSLPDSVIDARTARDMSLLAGNPENPEAYLGGVLSAGAQSEMGRSYMLTLLAHPTDKLGVILRRQSAIKELVRDELYAPLSAELKKTGGQNEAELLSFWSGLQLPGCLGRLYAKTYGAWNKTFNRSSYFLGFQSVRSSLEKSIRLLTQTLLIPAGVLSAIHATGVVEVDSSVTDFPSRFTDNPFIKWTDIVAGHHPSVQLVTSLSVAMLAASTIKGSYDWLQADIGITSLVQNKLTRIAEHFRSMQKIYHLVDKNPTLRNYLEHFDELEIFFKDESLSRLISALNASTFDSESVLFFNAGNVLVAWDLLMQDEIREKYEKALVSLAEIDALMGSAALVKDRGYCLTTFLDNSTSPVIDARGLRNPLTGTSGEENTIKLGTQDDRRKSCLLTGENGSGKSTNLQALLALVVSSQALGIGAANFAAITPFSCVRASRPGVDNAVKGLSGFTAEVDHLKKIQDEIPDNGLSCVFLDEAFKSTSAGASIQLAHDVILELESNPQVSMVVITNESGFGKVIEKSNQFQLFKAIREGRRHYLVSGMFTDASGETALRIAQERGLLK